MKFLSRPDFISTRCIDAEILDNVISGEVNICN